MSPQISTGPDPTRIGPFLIERKLGSGGMGTVYLARHGETRRETAVKILSPTLAREAGLVARFMREIDAMEKLKNPHVVELYDHGVDGETYYYAMEFIEGETLTARLRREKRIDWREVINLSMQICSALKAAHDAGIIHRDLKPSNLLLTTDGRVKLTDFGVAQVFAASRLTITGGIIGTAEYMSPEQAQGGRITKRSDLYSLGAVMYVMLTGRPPFSGKTTLDVIQKHKYSRFDRPRLIVPEIPHWLDEIVCQLMEKDPDKRFADAYVVYRRLQEVVRKVETSGREPTLGDGTASPDASTMAVGSEPGSRRELGQGSGTLMRDLFRAELEGEKGRSDLRKMFENTWVLFGLLALLIVAVGYWARSGRMTPQQRFDVGVARLEENEEANWRLVRDEYFAPLLELKSDEWDQKIAPYMARIRVQELRDGLSVKSGRARPRPRSRPATEIERILSLAQHYQDAGDIAAAERTLASLALLLEANPQYQTERQVVEEYLEEIRSRQALLPTDWSFVTAALARADALAGEGKRDEAARIWKGILDLYANDPRVATDVEQARRKLAGPAPKASP